MSKNVMQTGIAVVIAVVVIGYFFIIGNPFKVQQAMPNNAATTSGTSQLIIQDDPTSPGTGVGAKAGDVVSVNYTGRLQDGTVFDTSVGKAPISFTLGTGRVIPGWDQGLVGLKVGGKRTLIIPSTLGYGPQGYGPIPGGATLVFDVELMKISPPSATAPQQ